MAPGEGTVFIVDDDASVRRALERLVRSLKLNVKAFDSAKAFLDHGHYESPSCLVLDVRMPGISGIELQEQLKLSGIFMPVIFITGHGNIPMSVTAMKGGALDFIEKPFEDQKLINAINNALKKDRKFRAKHLEVVELQQRVDTLTPREHEVFILVISGMLNKQIAFDLGMSEKTVKVHRARVMNKMKAESLADLVRMFEKINQFKTMI